MPIKMGDLVQINCKYSKYAGVIGEVFAIQRSTQYAIVDMPKDTEGRIERFTENRIIEKMKRAEKTRKNPFSRWPKGDPEWFPLDWLIVVQSAPEQSDLAELELVDALA